MRGGGRGGRRPEEGIAVGEAEHRRFADESCFSERAESLRKRAESERRRADDLEGRLERQSAVVALLADAVRRLALEARDAPEAAELAGALADAGMLADEGLGDGRGSAGTAGAVGLTGREREVLSLAERGMTNREIGESLFITENTVRKHLKGVNRALGTSKKAEAVHAARRLGVL